jgi:uncharacterized damage-inducible protein DinB
METDAVYALIRLYRYTAWANRETLASLERLDAPPARAVAVMAHIVGTERLWWGRLQRVPSGIPVWPAWLLEECRAQLDAVAQHWAAYLQACVPEALDRLVMYTNSKGEHWTSTAGDIVTHVVLHGSYHRGQIAAEVRAAGHTPAYTDFIHATRQGMIE